MIIEFEGREWEYDGDKVSVQQAMVLHLAYGLTIRAWHEAIPELDPRALQFCYWLMKQQNGVNPGPLKNLDFAAVEFAAAYVDARKADEPDEDQEEDEEGDGAEPDPTPPSPPAVPPSTGPSTPTATTRGRRHPVPPEPTGS